MIVFFAESTLLSEFNNIKDIGWFHKSKILLYHTKLITSQYCMSEKWSVMIPVCNRLTYLDQTIRSVLAQDLGAGQMQICIVDNSTTPIDWVSFLKNYAPDRVEVFKQKKHMLMTQNWNTCITQSRGELIHILHDDDWVLPGFYDQVGETAEQHPDCGGFFVRCFVTSSDGEIDHLAARVPHLKNPSSHAGSLRYANDLMAPGVVVRKSAYDKVGLFNTTLVFTTDWEMWLRVIRCTSGISINRPLACYRFYEGNETSRLAQTAENLIDCLRLAQLMAPLDPDFDINYFRSMIRSLALRQANQNKILGNANAVVANSRMASELRVKVSFLRRLRSALSCFRKTLFPI